MVEYRLLAKERRVDLDFTNPPPPPGLLLMPIGIAIYHERDAESLVLELWLEEVGPHTQDRGHVLVHLEGHEHPLSRSNPKNMMVYQWEYSCWDR